MTEERDLREIYRLIYDKLRSIQKDRKFDDVIAELRCRTHKGKSDDFFFEQMCSVIFDSGLRASIIEKKGDEIRAAFSDYDVDKVANYRLSPEDVNSLKTRLGISKSKIESCPYNAKKIQEIVERHGSFGRYLDSFSDIDDLVKSLTEFKWIGETNAYGLLKYIGFDVMKPDRDVRRLLYRLGLIDEDKDTKEIRMQIQRVGRQMAEAVGEKVSVIGFVGLLFRRVKLC